MKLVLTLLYVLSAVLPLIGLVRLFRKARGERDSALKANYGQSSGVTFNAVGPLLESLLAATVRRPQEVKSDLGLVGGGIVLGGVASVLGVWFL
ncbi:hypothetical protein AB3K78_11825 [Leucobacter sp. HNU]|uniref:hypothetical protein n=1 Tax=Leucobacter sp. HNU TaxID=3236805 RepID=UPI003A7FBB8B